MMVAGEIEAALVRIYGADDPWAEFVLWLGEQRERNQRLGGADDTFCAAVVLFMQQVSFPLGKDRQISLSLADTVGAVMSKPVGVQSKALRGFYSSRQGSPE